MDKKNILTYEGLKKLEDELQNLKVVKRKEVAQKIKEAREQGDLSENAEYDAAKDEQRDIEARIEEIEKILKNAEVVVEEEVDLEKISIGCKVFYLVWFFEPNQIKSFLYVFKFRAADSPAGPVPIIILSYMLCSLYQIFVYI